MAAVNQPFTRFGLIRHARTLWNRDKRIQGQLDSPLSTEGRQAAIHWGKVLAGISWNRILASELERCQVTAALINQTLKVPLALDHRLIEQNWGGWSGRTLKDLQRKEAEALRKQIAAGWWFCPPQGESRQAVWQRSRNALIDAAGRWPGQNILTICHEGVIKALTYRLSQRRFMPDEAPLLQPGYLHWLVYKIDGLAIEALNAVPLNQE
jgi:probable phosphoglycerate mutase